MNCKKITENDLKKSFTIWDTKTNVFQNQYYTQQLYNFLRAKNRQLLKNGKTMIIQVKQNGYLSPISPSTEKHIKERGKWYKDIVHDESHQLFYYIVKYPSKSRCQFFRSEGNGLQNIHPVDGGKNAWYLIVYGMILNPIHYGETFTDINYHFENTNLCITAKRNRKQDLVVTTKNEYGSVATTFRCTDAGKSLTEQRVKDIFACADKITLEES